MMEDVKTGNGTGVKDEEEVGPMRPFVKMPREQPVPGEYPVHVGLAIPGMFR